MGKTVLILSASPRKNGNSEALCREFMKGAEDAGNKAEKIFLRDKKINYCIACDYCVKNGGKCVHKDDMEEILQKMIDANAIVMATPVYFYTMDAQMKTLIDRTVARYTEIRDKDAYFIITAADKRKEWLERTLEGFRGFADCLENIREKGTIYGMGVWKAGDIKGSPLLAQAYEMGKNV